ncbi:branched-chain amino acid ABC transporter permease [Acuticoccus sediminis]|uniref:Branched-chain amino acid ABC transporter permease n=1 Tax=Acuticoccus sediminis TaxID=2184697 RepID=A0A8B2NPH6_9HYPH|nr:branched-chain amino acid ABC transporter permease [Acuticoccus sediminis]RAH98830.1 branched-chain amino acid ABC transporter permease [Acuticoccus sediminis]
MAILDAPTDAATDSGSRAERRWWQLSGIPPAYWIVGLILLFMPVVASGFVLSQLLAWSFILGMIALSLMFLAGYGNMVSLVQMTVAGVAAYMVAIFGTSAVDTISLGWPWWVAAPVAILVAVLFGTLSGALAVRTEGIYTIMITLAIAAAMFYLVRQNYSLFNGFSGLNQVSAPVFWGVNWRAAVPFYYLCLVCAALSYLAVIYVKRSPFGLALQGVRDNPRRMAALGFNVTAHRIAAYAFASLIAGVAGVLLVWLNGQVSPGTIAVGPAIDILIIAVVGGLAHPIGPFLGALLYVFLRTFALDVLVSVGLAGERFQLLIGLGFLVVVFFSSDGLLGIWRRLRERSRRDPLTGETDG